MKHMSSKKRSRKTGILICVMLLALQSTTSTLLVSGQDAGLETETGETPNPPDSPQGGSDAFLITRGKHYWTFLPIPVRHGYAAVATLWILPTEYTRAYVYVEGKIKWVGNTQIHEDIDCDVFVWDNTALPSFVLWQEITRGEARRQVEWISIEIWVDLSYSPSGGYTQHLHAYKKVYGRNGPGDWGNEGCCFLAGTQVTMFDNMTKNIEDIEAGDIVQSYDVNTSNPIPGVVVETVQHDPDDMDPIYLIINGELSVTVDHPFYTADGAWVTAEMVTEGMLLGVDGIEVTSIGEVYEQVPTYDLVVVPVEAGDPSGSESPGRSHNPESLDAPLPTHTPLPYFVAGTYLVMKGAPISYDRTVLKNGEQVQTHQQMLVA